jgi:hypothetical protein
VDVQRPSISGILSGISKQGHRSGYSLQFMAGRPPIIDRENMTEKQIANVRQGSFEAQGSRGAQLIAQICPIDLTRRSLYSLVSVLSALADVRFERDFGRRKDLLIKWVDDNYDALAPWAPFIQLEVVEIR